MAGGRTGGDSARDFNELGRERDDYDRSTHPLCPLDADDAVETVQATVAGAEAQIAWVVGIPWQRSGIATEATVAMVRWLERRGVRGFSANIHARHAASRKIASRVGLVLTEDISDGEQVWRTPGTPAVR